MIVSSNNVKDQAAKIKRSTFHSLQHQDLCHPNESRRVRRSHKNEKKAREIRGPVGRFRVRAQDSISRSKKCEGCLVVRTGHGPQAEVAQVFGLELLVELGGRHLEGLEEEQQNGEEKETGEENNHHKTHKWTCMDGMTRARQLEPRCDTM